MQHQLAQRPVRTWISLYDEKRCEETSPPNKIIGDHDTDSPEGWATDQPVMDIFRPPVMASREWRFGMMTDQVRTQLAPVNR